MWRESAKGSIFHDLSFNGQGAFDADRSYVHGLGLVRMTDFSLQGDPVDYFHSDMLGTSRVLTDDTAAADHRLRFSALIRTRNANQEKVASHSDSALKDGILCQ